MLSSQQSEPEEEQLGENPTEIMQILDQVHLSHLYVFVYKRAKRDSSRERDGAGEYQWDYKNVSRLCFPRWRTLMLEESVS